MAEQGSLSFSQEPGSLSFSRKPGGRFIIGENVIVTIVRVKGDNVTVNVRAPKNLRISRDDMRQDCEDTGQHEIVQGDGDNVTVNIKAMMRNDIAYDPKDLRISRGDMRQDCEATGQHEADRHSGE